MQTTTGWRLDILSLLGGLLLGLGLVYAVYRWRPRLEQLQKRPDSPAQHKPVWVREGAEKRFHLETAAYVADYHLGARWATLEEIFVEPLPLAARSPVEAEPIAWEEAANLVHLWPEAAAGVATWPPATMSVRRLLLNGRRVILSAPSGAGKTTLLAYCAHLCAHASDSGPYTFLLPVMPVFVHLAELQLAGKDDEERDPAAPLSGALQRRAGPLTAPAVTPLLRQKLANGQVLFLLDGWDEAGPTRQSMTSVWLARLLAKYPDIQVIMATGSRGFGPLQALRFTVSGLLPWRAHQAELAGELWAAVCGWGHRPALTQYWEGGHSPLRASLHLWQWAAQQQPEQGQLTALLDAALMQFLPAGEKTAGWLPRAAQRLWQRLALRLVHEGGLSLSETAIREEIAAVLAEAGLDEQNEAALQQTATPPFFRQWPDKSVSFLSPVWRDFLAGTYLVESKAQEMVQAHLADSHWAGAIRFYAARAGGETAQLADRLLDGRRAELWHDQLFQMAGWLSMSEGRAEWRRRVLIRLGRLITEPDIPEVLRVRAVATLACTGEIGIEELLRQLLQRTEPELRRAAVMALARFDSEVSVPLMERMLKDPDESVRLATIHALGWQNSPLAETPLLGALIGRREAERSAAALALALNGGDGWEILREAAVDNDSSVRQAAVQGLASLDKYWAVQLLEKIVHNDDEQAVQAAASKALDRIAERNRLQPWRVVEAGELPWLQAWAEEHEQVLPEGEEAVITLRRVLAEGRLAEQRVAAASSLARVYLPPHEKATVCAVLEEAAKNDEEWIVREVAFAALAELHRGIIL